MAKSHRATFDVVVVGNGVLGLSIALAAARRKLAVALLGKPHRPWSASTAAGAMLGCFGEVTTTLLASEPGRAKLLLAMRARKLWDGWLESLAECSEHRSQVRVADGTVVLLNNIGVAGIDDANFAAIKATVVDYGEPHEVLDAGAIEWLDPDPRARPQHALYLPNEHAVDSGMLLEQLERAFVRSGGTLVDELAVALESSVDAVTGVTMASGGTLSTRAVVVTAGARSHELLLSVPNLAARIPPICSGVGVSALLECGGAPAPRNVIRTPNRAFACGLHMVPRRAGEVYVGATNIIEADVADTPAVRDLMFLLECATHQLRRELWLRGLNKVQVGNRPVALDGFPLIGETSLSGLWLVTGTYRDGLTLSPLLGEEIARRIVGQKPQINLDLFRPERPPIQAADRQSVVGTAVMHMLATGYEQGWQIPSDWPRTIENQLRAAYKKFADELDEQYTPPPEILVKARVTPLLAKRLREFYAATRSASAGI